jgi:putative phosphoribosyl transferase
MVVTRFRDRAEAGSRLGARLAHLAKREGVIVLALPRGGVPVAFEVATALGAPLDVLLVRKLGVPGQPELAMGAIASGGVRVLNRGIIAAAGIGESEIDWVARREEAELRRRERAYRGNRPSPDVRGKTAIVVDDGIATGSTMLAAVDALRRLQAGRVIVAAPAAARSACVQLSRVADEVVALLMPDEFSSVGEWYEQFPQTTDEEVIDLLSRAA